MLSRPIVSDLTHKESNIADLKAVKSLIELLTSISLAQSLIWLEFLPRMPFPYFLNIAQTFQCHCKCKVLSANLAPIFRPWESLQILWTRTSILWEKLISSLYITIINSVSKKIMSQCIFLAYTLHPVFNFTCVVGYKIFPLQSFIFLFQIHPLQYEYLYFICVPLLYHIILFNGILIL
jgi:hypothetical protein